MYLTLIIFSTVAVCMSFFMIAHILFLSKGTGQKKIALALLMFALMLRTLKSVFYFLLYPKLSIWFLMMGFAGFSMIGPLAYRYFTSKLENNLSHITGIQWLDLLFPVGGVFLLYFFPRYVESLYFLCLLSMGFYLVLGYRIFSQQKAQKNTWDNKLFTALAILFAAFLMPYILRFSMSYAIGTAIASLTIFVLFFFYLKDAPRFGKNVAKHKVTDKHKQHIISALETDAVYRDSSINLNTFSSKLNIPQYIILQVIKDTYGTSFHGTINGLRIKEAKQRLREPMSDIKIETLAYDVGFNTVSAFYAVFKKETSMSPREYQRLNWRKD